jgi:hypothetical protein
MAIYPPGAIAESGTRKESFDTATRCLTYKDEMIQRSTKTQADYFSTIHKDDRCIWTTDTTDCQNPASESHLHIERWVKTFAPLLQNWTNDEAGYTETMDSVGYDTSGNLVEDSHSNYLRKTAADQLFATPVGLTAFTVNYYETGETVEHPMSYYANYLIGGGPGGGNVWSGASQIPQWEPTTARAGPGSTPRIRCPEPRARGSGSPPRSAGQRFGPAIVILNPSGSVSVMSRMPHG